MKTLTSLALSGSLALVGCEAQVQYQTQTAVDSIRYSFDNFGYKEITSNSGFGGASITSSDFDGDGDIDIATINDYGHLTIIENKIPQKGR